MRILDRYLLRELALPFALGIALFTTILLIARILKLVEMVVNRGVPFLQMVKLFSYILPAFLEVTVPMALLLAVLVGLGRLSSDSEVVALQASGIGIGRLAVPVAMFATAVFVLTLALSMYARPWGNSRLRAGLYEIVKARASAGIKPRVFNDDFKGLVIYVDQIEPPGDVLRGIVISDSREGDEINTVFARSGTIVSREESQTLTLRLIDGSAYTVAPAGKGFQDTRFSTYDINLDLNLFVDDPRRREREPNEMSYMELRRVIGTKSAARQAAFEERVEVQRKFAIPFACFVFAALGLPLGIHSTRAVHSRGLVTSLALIFVYYLLLTLAQTFGERGTVAPEIALWAPNVLLSLVAAWLIANRWSGTTSDGAPWPAPLAALVRSRLSPRS